MEISQTNNIKIMCGVEDIEIHEEMDVKLYDIKLPDAHLLLTEIEIDNITTWEELIELKRRYNAMYIYLLIY